MDRYIYGIDFGTSNSALSIIDTNTNEIIKTFNEASLIYFPQPAHTKDQVKPFVGKAAIEQYVDSKMQGRFMKSLKRVLPRSGFTETRVYSQKFKAEDLVAIILDHLKTKADKFLGHAISKAVMGRPVVFDEDPTKDHLAQSRLLKAATLAGFESVAFQMEPIAAAFTYERNITKNENVLVADLGGGTSDFTLMKLSPDKLNETDRKNDIIGQGGIYIGGDNFDASIMWEKGTPHFGRGLTYKDFDTRVDVPKIFYQNICSWEKMNFFDSIRLQNSLDKYYYLTGNHFRFKNLMTLVRNNLGYSIFQAIEKAKIDLSSEDEAYFDYERDGIDVCEPITLEEFSNEIASEDIAKIRGYLINFLERSNLTANEIDTVFMTGGTSLVTPIRKFMIELFGENALKTGDNFNSVVHGLAYSHVLFFQ